MFQARPVIYKISFLLLCLLTGITGHAQCHIDYSGWKLVLDENFDAPTTVQDLEDRWFLDYRDDPDKIGFGSEYYDRSQVSIINGICRLKATRIPDNVTISPISNTTHDIRYKSGILYSHYVIDSPGRWGSNGFLYGIYEIRAKLPRGAAWPAFWLYSGPTEIDIMDDTQDDISRTLGMGLIDWDMLPGSQWAKGWELVPGAVIVDEYTPQAFLIDRDYSAGDIVQRDGKVYRAQQDIRKMSFAMFPHKRGIDLSNSFNTYTCVWTPQYVSYFLNGVEICTISSNVVKTHDGPACIKVNLQMKSITDPNHPAPTDEEYNMDVDYIRVWKPRVWTWNNYLDGNRANKYEIYNIPYKTSSEFMHHNVTQSSTHPAVPVVSTTHNSIAPSTDGTQLFYKDQGNSPCVAQKVNNTWTATKLVFNDGPDVLADGDIKYLPYHNVMIYAGANHRVNLFGPSSSTPSGFYHWYVSSNASCYWCVNDDYISTAAGSLQTSENGEIFYRGLDNKLHWYHNQNGNWIHQILPSSYTNDELVQGDVIVESTNNANSVYYKGNDNRIQLFYKDGSGNYHHAWLDNLPNYVSTKPGSMTFAPNLSGILYRGTDDKAHLYYWDMNWIHQVLPYTYGAPTVSYPYGDKLYGGLTWDNSNNRLYYQGWDGRIQAFEKSGTQWTHRWINDYWNTDEFSTFSTMDNNGIQVNYSSAITGPEGVYYMRRDQNLAYFKYEACEVLDPPFFSEPNLSRPSGQGPLPNMPAGNIPNEHILIYPNPAENGLFQLSGAADSRVEVVNLMGRTILKKEINSQVETLDLGQVSPGVYFVLIRNGQGVVRKEIIVGH